MSDTFYIKRNDLQPYFYVKAIESTGTAIDLTGATIRFSMVNLSTNAIAINRQTAGVTITAAATGLFQYQWQSGDTATTGTYAPEFEITPGSGGKFTLPINRDSKIIIVADEDAT